MNVRSKTSNSRCRIGEMQRMLTDPHLAWMFGNSIPHILIHDSKPGLLNAIQVK